MKIIFSVIFYVFFSSLILRAQSYEELWELYSGHHYDSVIEKGLEYLESGPDHAELNLIVGRSLADKGNYMQAISYLKKAAYSETNEKHLNSWAFGYLGTCYFMIGQPDKSTQGLNKTIELNATRNSVRYAYKRKSLFGLDAFFNNWAVDSTHQIIFHFQDEKGLDKERFMSERQQALEVIMKSFPVELPKKIDFFVWKSKEDAREVLKANIGFSNPGYLIVHSREDQSKGHELTHVITHHSINPITKSRFINEGIATLYDQTNRNRLAAARRSITEYGDHVSIEGLWKNGRDYPESLVYPVGTAWMEYCYQVFSEDQVIKILRNQKFGEAERVLGKDLMVAVDNFDRLLMED